MEDAPQTEEVVKPSPPVSEVKGPTEYEIRRDAANIVSTLIAGSLLPRGNPIGVINELTNKMVKVLENKYQDTDYPTNSKMV